MMNEEEKPEEDIVETEGSDENSESDSVSVSMSESASGSDEGSDDGSAEDQGDDESADDLNVEETEGSVQDEDGSEAQDDAEPEDDLEEGTEAFEEDGGSESEAATDAAEVPSEDDEEPETVAESEEGKLSEDQEQNEAEYLRMIEALLFAAAEPLDVKTLKDRMPEQADVPALLDELKEFYSTRGVNLKQIGDLWAFRTSDDLSFLMQKETVTQRRLSRAGVETLAIVAYHQPVTRAEIEEIRGVAVSKGTIDVLLEVGWIKPRGRRRTPGRPLTYGTTHEFLDHFGLENIKDLPGLEELKAAGLLDSALPPDFKIGVPDDRPAEEQDDEDQLDVEDFVNPASRQTDDD